MTAPRPRAWVSWSSGKDSALALHETLAADDVDVVGLLTTVNATADRVAMHAVRRDLLEAQATALRLPLHVVELPWPCSNDVYEERMREALVVARGNGVTQVVFGDLFLADIRAYRETAMASSGITPVFPLWGRPTDEVGARILEVGIRAVLTCVDPRQLAADLCGRWYDETLLAELPPGADACGENGEFHTFVAASPDFDRSIPVEVGVVVERDGFVFADVLRTA